MFNQEIFKMDEEKISIKLYDEKGFRHSEYKKLRGQDHTNLKEVHSLSRTQQVTGQNSAIQASAFTPDTISTKYLSRL